MVEVEWVSWKNWPLIIEGRVTETNIVNLRKNIKTPLFKTPAIAMNRGRGGGIPKMTGKCSVTFTNDSIAGKIPELSGL